MGRIAHALMRFGLGLPLAMFAQMSLATPAGYEPDTRAYNLAHGRVVFADKCLRCHESGRRGAPVIGETDDWRKRLEQPLDTLIQHAIRGHGDMPARGDQEISGQDVAAAVAYVVNRVRVIAAERIEALPPAATPAATASASDPGEPTSDTVVQMFLLLLGKPGGIESNAPPK